MNSPSALGKSASKNPIVVLLIAIIFSITILIFSNKYESDIGNIWHEVLNTIASAILVSGTLGLWFDYFGKADLISEVVESAVGQTKCLSAGITDLKIKVTEVDEKIEFVSSSYLAIGTRRSSGVLDRYKDEIRRRLRSGKSLIIVMQKDASMFPTAQNFSATPIDFIQGLESTEPGISANVKLYQTDEILSYNFVSSDRGMWLKLYFNSRQPELPPAMFVSVGTPLHDRFQRDVDLILVNGREMQL